jgi:hypothetical protein
MASGEGTRTGNFSVDSCGDDAARMLFFREDDSIIRLQSTLSICGAVNSTAIGLYQNPGEPLPVQAENLQNPFAKIMLHIRPIRSLTKP